MFILALNCGSSSLKFQVFDTDKYTAIIKGNCERIGDKNSFIKYSFNNKKETKNIVLENHSEGLDAVINIIKECGINLQDIKAVGHRVVHGGDKFSCSVEVTPSVIEEIKNLTDLAPLHNPSNLLGIYAAQELLPNAKHVAVFDTAFNQTMPDFNYRYAVPNSWYKNLKVRKYGFHGTSHLYVSKRAAVMLKKNAKDCNIISMHIGSGASAVAIKNGNCFDTSLGMSTNAGLVMGTRSGDIDPSVPFYVKEKLGLSDKLILEELNKKSGILGLTECYTDRRDVEEHLKDNKLCKLAFDIEVMRAKKFIGAFLAAMEAKTDAIVFTAGVGENGCIMREAICSNMEYLGIKLDKEKNDKAIAYTGCGEMEINTDDSPIKIFMIPTNEELVIIEDTIAILQGTYNSNHLLMDYTFSK